MSTFLTTLSENPMYIVAIVAIIFCILLIPCIFYNKHVKAAGQRFIDSHRGQALLHINGSKILIDGKDLSQFDCSERDKESAYLSLEPGEHRISALFGPARSVDRFGTKNPIEVTLNLEANYQYFIAGYEYSAEQRRNYYKGEVPEHILDMPVGNKYLICYKESAINGNIL